MQTSLNTGNEIILPSKTETLLGFKIHENLKFNEYLTDSKDALIKTLNKRIGALKLIKNAATFKAKLSIANGIFMSKVLYLLPLYSGCPEYLLNAIQIKQNEAMRQITGRRWVIPGVKLVSTAELLRQCNWMSIRQLSFYTTVHTVHKILTKKEPEYLYEELTSGKRHNTRAAKNHILERTCVDGAKLSMASNSFRWRGHKQHSMIPDFLQDESNLIKFNRELKLWVKDNVHI